MKAEIITSGSELLLGEIADTNTSFLAAALARLGIDLYHASIVGDNFERYSALLRQAWQRADIIFTTGGLGPTRGDISREVVAGLLGETMTVHPELKETLTAFFTSRGIEMPDNNLKQATLIPSAVALPNRAGTAPGWWVEKENRIIVLLPGPPVELQDMWYREVLPRLQARSGSIILSRTLKTWGISEGLIDELVAPFLSCANPTLGIYAKGDGIHLRITAKCATEPEARELVSAREQELRDILKTSVWGADEDSLENGIARRLIAAGKTLAVAETLTAGMLAQSFAQLPGAAAFFKGGLVTPSSTEQAGEQHARDMAHAARRQFGADITLAIDGYWESDDKEVRSGAFVAIDDGESVDTHAPGMPGRLPQFTRRILTYALSTLLNKLPPAD